MNEEKENKTIFLHENDGSFQRATSTGRGKGVAARRDRRAETSMPFAREAEPGEIKMSHYIVKRLYDETLDPKDRFWDEIGIDQDRLTVLISENRLPVGYTFAQFTARVSQIKIIPD